VLPAGNGHTIRPPALAGPTIAAASQSPFSGDFTKKHPFIDKQSQIAERKTVGEQGPGNSSKEAA
jgi:hypothetical protein